MHITVVLCDFLLGVRFDVEMLERSSVLPNRMPRFGVDRLDRNSSPNSKPDFSYTCSREGMNVDIEDNTPFELAEPVAGEGELASSRERSRSPWSTKNISASLGIFSRRYFVTVFAGETV